MKIFFKIILTFIVSLLINTQYVLADSAITTDNNDKDISVNIEKTDDNKKSVASSNRDDDIFGDEQTFPFVAGLGKNAAH